MKHVIISEAQVKHYRLPFYMKLYEVLQRHDINLRVAYSNPVPSKGGEDDTRNLPQHCGFKVDGYWLWPERLVYQPLLRPYLRSDLVIADEGNRYVLNHVLMALSLIGVQRVAFWGLAENRRHDRLPVSEWYRAATLNWATHWFAYTRRTAAYLESQGVPSSKITIVYNSVDTREITECVRGVTPREKVNLRLRLGIPANATIGIFSGTLQQDKCIPFLIKSSHLIKAQMPSFHLIIVGTGREREAIDHLVECVPWIHVLGARFGREKAELLAIADAFLIPGRVGLAILDAFAAGIPIVTTRLETHGPEIEYLERNVNGVMSQHDPIAYADTVSSLLCERGSLDRLRAGAIASCDKYSIDNMVANFAEGIKICLGMSRAEKPSCRQPTEELGAIVE